MALMLACKADLPGTYPKRIDPGKVLERTGIRQQHREFPITALAVLLDQGDAQHLLTGQTRATTVAELPAEIPLDPGFLI